MRLSSLIGALLLLPGVCCASSLGVYAPRLLPDVTPDDTVWTKYARLAVASNVAVQIQGTYDRLCERVDLLSTNYVAGIAKTNLVLEGCPMPDVRAEAVTTEDRGLSKERYQNLYGAMCGWMTRDSSVETTPGTSFVVYPDWQSPLCADPLLEIDGNQIITYNADVYPSSLSRFGFDATNRTDLRTHLSTVATRLNASYVATTNEYSMGDLDTRYCSFVLPPNETASYVDELAPKGFTDSVLSWNILQSFDRILADLGSENVATLDFSPYLSHTLRRTQTTRNTRFDTTQLTAWLLANCTTNVAVSDVVYPLDDGEGTNELSPATVTSPQAVLSARHAATGASGYIKRVGQYWPNASNENWRSTGTGLTQNGRRWFHYLHCLYTETASLADTGTVSYNTLPSETVYVTEGATESTTEAVYVSAANVAFTTSPEYFERTKMTVVCGDETAVLAPEHGIAQTNHTLVSRLSVSTNSVVTGLLTNEIQNLCRLSAAETAVLTTSAVPMTVTLYPAVVSDPYPVYEYRTVVVNTATGATYWDNTFSARADGGDHYPKMYSDDSPKGPDESAGEAWATGYIPTDPRSFLYRQGFSSVYPALTNGNSCSVSKTWTNPTVIFENRYQFDTRTVKPDEPAMDAIGPSDDYGDGDGGVADFDVIVDPISYASGTTDGRIFGTLEAAVAAVNPDGGSHAVTNRIPKIGIMPGDYDLPKFFSVRPFFSTTVVPPYDVRLVGIGKGVVIHRGPTQYVTGRYVIIRQEGDVYYTLAFSRMENLTLDMGTGQRIDYLTAFSLYNCNVIGSIRYRDTAFADSRLYRCNVDIVISTYDTVWTYRPWYNRPPIFNGAYVSECVINFDIQQDYHPPLINEYSYLHDTVLTCGPVDTIQVGGATTEPVFIDSTIRIESAGNLNNTRIPLAATNCLFFVDGLTGTAPYAVDNVMTNKALFGTILDSKTKKPGDGYKDLRSHGFHNYIYPRK